MSDPVRLARRVAELARCSRNEAEQYVQGGWVKVDGRVVEAPNHMVSSEAVEIDPAAQLQANEPATVLLHKPAGVDVATGANPALALVTPATRWSQDASGVRLLQQHFQRLVALAPLEREASGLVVLSQDRRVRRRLVEDMDAIEQEFVVEVDGALDPWGLGRLGHGLAYEGRALAPCKVSWQNETRLRFAIKGVRPGQLRDMCAQVGLQVLSIRRIRIGRIALAKMPAGNWRYLPVGEKF
ncbi:RNA pseudouridine synthase [Pseudoxanthomonas koreensis]|uniref:RNA pseudouridine synthase n=1 Tax=Pseudoxanthomonas koreensis TaxID=266061 RepID=UPI0035A5A278